MRLDQAIFTIFDFETTGLFPYSGDKICEIGAVRFNLRSKQVKKFHTLVDPGQPVSPGAFFVNGITEEMLKAQPSIGEVLPKFLKFIEGSALVAYNAGFDLGFLESALGEGKAILDDYKVIDALALARRLFPGMGRYNLGTVSAALGIDSAGEHRAMADAVMTWKIFKKELESLAAEGVTLIDNITRANIKRKPFVRAVKDYKTRLIEEAIRDQKKLNIIYRSAWHDTVTERVITPKEIKNGYDRSYVIAYCHLKNDERNFRFDCILEAKPYSD